MVLKYEHHEGSQKEKPLAIDITSSSTKVYLRKNINKVSKIDPITEENYELWEYDEAIISHKEYDQIAADFIIYLEKNAVDLNDTLDVILTEELPNQEEQIGTLSDTMDNVLVEELPNQNQQIQNLADTIDDLMTNILPNL